VFWPAVSSVISGVSGGAKLGCVASPFNKIARELIVRKEIDSLAALREKIFGVQSIGGGFWLQTMIVLDRLGVDAEKYKLQMRVIGDEPTILQAVLASNIDAAVITQASAAVAKRAGLRSLADTADLKVPYQGVGSRCGTRSRGLEKYSEVCGASDSESRPGGYQPDYQR
jgi:ABC-type nitrate/sulfonate/bicarbonate transport system substrate-binding protein